MRRAADGQTHRYKDTLIAIVHTPPGGEVKITPKTSKQRITKFIIGDLHYIYKIFQNKLTSSRFDL